MKKKMFVVIMLLVAVMVGLSAISACTQTKGVVSDQKWVPSQGWEVKTGPTWVPTQGRDIEMDPKKWVETQPISLSGSNPCITGNCAEREGTWRGNPLEGTKTFTLGDGDHYGRFMVVYDSKKGCPAVQHWRKSPSDPLGERFKLWFKDRAMAEAWAKKDEYSPQKLDGLIAGKQFKSASVGYQIWIDLK